MTQEEINDIAQKAKIIAELDIDAFLLMIQAKADIWIKELS
jgi:hypothetical protein